MDETLYRRNQDGMLETVVPQAQGKAAALSSYLARGGTPFQKSGRFKKGPNKGKNTDEAVAEFERLWANSPDALKQKYADRTSGRMTDLAPSERMKAQDRKTTSTPAPPSAKNSTQVVFSGGGGEAGKISAPKLAIASHQTMPSIAGKSRSEQADILSADAVSSLPTDERMKAQGKVNVAQRPIPATTSTPISPVSVSNGGGANLSPLAQRELASRKAAVDATPTGRPVVAKPAPGINRVTGLPFGYQPGDAQTVGTPAINPTLAAQSIKRQEVATSKAALASRATPATPARPPTYLEQSAINRPRTVGANTPEGQAANVMRQQAAIMANPSAVNPPGMKLVGPKRPLNELVARAKARGVGTPAMLPR